MKGILLAGGTGSRLLPITLTGSKQLLPVYDKPLIYYPLSTLLEAGIREILIITAPRDANQFKRLLGDGSQLGCEFQYAVQERPAGIAEAFLIGREFIGDDKVVLILGDNIFYGSEFTGSLKMNQDPVGGIIYGYHVHHPERYGVVEFDKEYNVLSIEEKPEKPKSNYVVPGIYFYDNEVVEIAENIQPSERGELEITDINKFYLERGALKVILMDRGTAWLDTGTFASMMQAANFVQVIEERQGLKIGAIEEVAYSKGYIDKRQLKALATPLIHSGYGEYLLRLLK